MANENPAKYDLTLHRVFDAPRDLVWKAWTEPAQLTLWWGPKNFTNPVCRADAKPGGEIYIEMLAPNGTVYPMAGTFLEVNEPEFLSFESRPLDDKGNVLFEIHTAVTFKELDGKTALTLEARVLKMTAPNAAQFLDGMREGWNQSLDRLANLVTTERTQ